MLDKEDICYFCLNPAVGVRNIIVDADAGHDGDTWYRLPLHSEVGLCQEHIDAYENGELYDNEFDYTERGE